VLGDHYKLLPIDLCDIQKLDNIIALAIWIPGLVNSRSFLLKYKKARGCNVCERSLLGGCISCILIICEGFASSSNKLLFIKRKHKASFCQLKQSKLLFASNHAI
jgi:hypothetical protein